MHLCSNKIAIQLNVHMEWQPASMPCSDSLTPCSSCQCKINSNISAQVLGLSDIFLITKPPEKVSASYFSVY